jgi:hypothetical protein
MNPWDHSVAGNGKRDGLKTSWKRAISSRAARPAEGSEAILKKSRSEGAPKHLAGLEHVAS